MGQMKDTGLKGAWPVRYSADGQYMALRSSNSGTDEQLRVVAIKDLARKDIGQFAHIGHIKPIEDGSFLACARIGQKFEVNATVGVMYSPDSGVIREVWKLPSANAEIRTDFDPIQMIGVTTSFRLVTRLIDLRAGMSRLTIDNSANYWENIVTYTSRDLPFVGSSHLWLVAAPLALAACVVVWVLRKRRRIKSPTS